MSTRETFGQRLQRLRVQAGLTQAQVAEAADVPVSSLRNWEIDRREPGLRVACRLAKVLGVTAEHLADTVPVDEVGRAVRPAGPTKRPALTSPAAPEKKPAPKKRPRRRKPGGDHTSN
jgi:transcriptional regulator with XRE-family HTH domain